MSLTIIPRHLTIESAAIVIIVNSNFLGYCIPVLDLSGRANWMTDDVIAPRGTVRIVDAQPLKMAVTYI